MKRTLRRMSALFGVSLLMTIGVTLAPTTAKAADAPKSTFQASDSALQSIRKIQEERIKHLLNKAKVYPQAIACLSSGSPLWSCYDKIKADKTIETTAVSGTDILQTNASEGIAQIFITNDANSGDILAITSKGRILEIKDERLVSAAHDILSFKEAGIPYITQNVTSYWEIVLRAIPILFEVFMLFFLIIMGIMQGKQVIHFFSNPAVRMKSDKIVPFSEIAGNDYVKTELLEIADAVKSKNKAMLAAIPSGLLMSGPPGCGKTMIAAAFAKECGLPFYHVAGSDFVEMFVGLGARRVSIMFNRLRKRHAVSVLFIDEIDSIGKKRSNHGDPGSSEQENTLNKLLQMMDGAGNKTLTRRKRGRIIVLAATNRPDILDSALLRPERLERTISFQLPPQPIREQIAAIYMKNQSYAADVTPKMVGLWTPGFSGADIKSVLNQALIQAGRERSSVISASHITHAIDLHLMGEPSQIVLSKEDRDITAWHEGAHALIAMMLIGPERVRSITILPRGKAMGMVAMTPAEGRYSQSLNDLLSAIFIAVSGRAGEFIKEDGHIERVTTGASQDIVQATDIARDIVERFGFASLTGMMTHTYIPHDPRYSRELSQKRSAEIDELVTDIVSRSFNEVVKILTVNKEAFSMLVETLLRDETITGIDAWKTVSAHIVKDGSSEDALAALTAIIHQDAPILDGTVSAAPKTLS